MTEPVLRTPPSRALRRFLTEVKTFLDPGLQNEDDRRYFRVLFFSGLRPGEQIGLQWDDIDWQRKIICVRRSIGRFGKGPTKTAESMLELDESPGLGRPATGAHERRDVYRRS